MGIDFSRANFGVCISEFLKVVGFRDSVSETMSVGDDVLFLVFRFCLIKTAEFSQITRGDIPEQTHW